MPETAVIMSLRDHLTKALQSALNVVTDTGTKAATGVVKHATGAAKDLTGIRKDLVETKVAEIKVEDHESQIQKATLRDVMKYDPKTSSLIIEIRKTWTLNCYHQEFVTFHFHSRIVTDRVTRRHLGSIRYRNHGLAAFDNRNRILARYHDATNTTRDRSNRFLANGNVLESVIRNSASGISP